MIIIAHLARIIASFVQQTIDVVGDQTLQILFPLSKEKLGAEFEKINPICTQNPGENGITSVDTATDYGFLHDADLNWDDCSTESLQMSSHHPTKTSTAIEIAHKTQIGPQLEKVLKSPKQLRYKIINQGTAKGSGYNTVLNSEV